MGCMRQMGACPIEPQLVRRKSVISGAPTAEQISGTPPGRYESASCASFPMSHTMRPVAPAADLNAPWHARSTQLVTEAESAQPWSETPAGRPRMAARSLGWKVPQRSQVWFWQERSSSTSGQGWA